MSDVRYVPWHKHGILMCLVLSCTCTYGIVYCIKLRNTRVLTMLQLSRNIKMWHISRLFLRYERKHERILYCHSKTKTRASNLIASVMANPCSVINTFSSAWRPQPSTLFMLKVYRVLLFILHYKQIHLGLLLIFNSIRSSKQIGVSISEVHNDIVLYIQIINSRLWWILTKTKLA